MDILLRAQNVQYPSVWEQVESQTENLQLYNVNPASNEVAALVAEVESHGNSKVLKVCHGILTASASINFAAFK